MSRRKKILLTENTNLRFVIYSLCSIGIVAGIFFGILLQQVGSLFVAATEVSTSSTPFLVSVDPSEKSIIQTPDAAVLEADIEVIIERKDKNSFWGTMVYQIAQNPIMQNIASPLARVVVIWPGDRKEEAAAAFQKILGWNNEEAEVFLTLVLKDEPYLEEGVFAPGKYFVTVDTTPEEAAALVKERFLNDVLNRYSEDVAEIVPLNDALVIASLLEREAYDFNDMREISGVIWNRLFIDMKLQLDATLQYAKGDASRWWQVPVPDDKYLDSPFNTYQNNGLPPHAIANPSVSAILAALNPNETNCLFYFHHRNALYCSEDYEGHVQKLRSLYGRGN